MVQDGLQHSPNSRDAARGAGRPETRAEKSRREFLRISALAALFAAVGLPRTALGQVMKALDAKKRALQLGDAVASELIDLDTTCYTYIPSLC